MAFVLGLLQHTPVEMEPGELPVDEPLRASGKLGQGHRDRRRNGRGPAAWFRHEGFFNQNKSFTAVSHDTGGVIEVTNDTVCRFGDMMARDRGAASSSPPRSCSIWFRGHSAR